MAGYMYHLPHHVAYLQCLAAFELAVDLNLKASGARLKLHLAHTLNLSITVHGPIIPFLQEIGFQFVGPEFCAGERFWSSARQPM
jgi:hypothetical protein